MGRMKRKPLKPGDAVEWRSSRGKMRGTVEQRLTAPVEIEGHHVAATADHPELLVRSDKTGALAAHQPKALTPRR
jgi:hypothetical protein